MSDTAVPEEAAAGWLSWKLIVALIIWGAQVTFLNKHIKKMSQIRPKNEEDVKRDEKYACFRQSDISTDSLLSRLMIYTCCAPLILARSISAMLILSFLQCWCFTIFTLVPPSSPYHKPILFFGTRLCGYGLLACCSVVWVTKVRPAVCYKKYLGEDWEPYYEGQSSNIFNHSAWIDTLTMMTQFTPCFVAKASVRQLPWIGYTAWRCGSLFIDRIDKDDRAKMYKVIADHQEGAEAGKHLPLSLAPEGGTTNGTAIIKFKKGAFASLKSLKPYGLDYSSPMVPIQSGVIPFESHAILLGGNPFATCTIKELPVFKPNEFFWKNHA